MCATCGTPYEFATDRPRAEPVPMPHLRPVVRHARRAQRVRTLRRAPAPAQDSLTDAHLGLYAHGTRVLYPGEFVTGDEYDDARLGGGQHHHEWRTGVLAARRLGHRPDHF